MKQQAVNKSKSEQGVAVAEDYWLEKDWPPWCCGLKVECCCAYVCVQLNECEVALGPVEGE